MKRIICGFGLLTISALLGAFAGFHNNSKQQVSDSDTRTYAQASVLYQGVDEVLEDADIIVTGTVCDINAHDEYDEYIVSVTDTKKGSVSNQIAVRNYLYEYSYSDEDAEIAGKTNLAYETGKEYIFVLQHVQNVYEDIYMILSDTYMPLENAEDSSILASKIDDIENCEEYIDQYQFKNAEGKGEKLSIDYTESNDKDVILEESSYIALVEIQELYRSTEAVDVYACDVKEIIKGNITTTEDNQILIPFFKDTVDIGESDIVCLNSDSDDSIIYTLSSENSVMGVSELASVRHFVNKEDGK